MIYGPKPDGTYVVEFKIADGEALAISVPASETRVLKHFSNMRHRATAALALIAALAPPAAHAQTSRGDICIQRQCGECVRQRALVLGRAGEPRVSRLAQETQRRGGGVAAAHTLRGTRDFQAVLRDLRRACGCPSWC